MSEASVTDVIEHGISLSPRKSVLVLAALGVVFGDIGTSPLYALHKCFSGGHAIRIYPSNILGAVSLIFWFLFVIVCVKYDGTMLPWRKQIFMFLSKNSLDASSFFKLPPNRVVELGAQIEF